MSFVSEPVPFPPIEEDPNRDFHEAQWLQQLYMASQNILLTQREGAIQHNDKAGQVSGVYVVYTSNGTANTEDTVSHPLGRVPVGIVPVKQDKAGILYDSTTLHTSSTLYLKSSAASVAWTVLVF